ncbi:DUF6477 family protein [Marinibacterium profundimaris]|uniref:Uncharacterized protein n=1 Tax=Marinibacterium profundimaris TaxID=1679460 RepID=A0A225NRE1_9RHOB|nr:DUF6477 family protein [Marinibacterium profundimaris]OWU77435.1 hypothetical protein ATO3_01630 [Marinibacterium profundimaris]
MHDLLSMVTALRRPRLLVRAARSGAAEYRRDRHLQRLLGYGTLPRPAPALMKLMDIESELDGQRRTGDTAYSLIRHIDVLIAMMGEARLIRSAQSGETLDGVL